MKYFSRVFDVETFPQAKHVVLTSDPDNPEKFQQETDFLINQLKRINIITATSQILDFGCGMGRVAKSLIEEFQCSVTGMDISESMKRFATLYVCQPKLFTTSDVFPTEQSIDVALAILVLQHTENPSKEIAGIFKSLKPNGYFVLLNEANRLVPSGVDIHGFVTWQDDGFDVRSEVLRYAKPIQTLPYINSDKYIEIYQKQ